MLGVSLRARRHTTQVMLGLSLRARWDTTLVIIITLTVQLGNRVETGLSPLDEHSPNAMNAGWGGGYVDVGRGRCRPLSTSHAEHFLHCKNCLVNVN